MTYLFLLAAIELKLPCDVTDHVISCLMHNVGTSVVQTALIEKIVVIFSIYETSDSHVRECLQMILIDLVLFRSSRLFCGCFLSVWS